MALDRELLECDVLNIDYSDPDDPDDPVEPHRLRFEMTTKSDLEVRKVLLAAETGHPTIGTVRFGCIPDSPNEDDIDVIERLLVQVPYEKLQFVDCLPREYGKPASDPQAGTSLSVRPLIRLALQVAEIPAPRAIFELCRNTAANTDAEKAALLDAIISLFRGRNNKLVDIVISNSVDGVEEHRIYPQLQVNRLLSATNHKLVDSTSIHTILLYYLKALIEGSSERNDFKRYAEQIATDDTLSLDDTDHIEEIKKLISCINPSMLTINHLFDLIRFSITFPRRHNVRFKILRENYTYFLNLAKDYLDKSAARLNRGDYYILLLGLYASATYKMHLITDHFTSLFSTPNSAAKKQALSQDLKEIYELYDYIRDGLINKIPQSDSKVNLHWGLKASLHRDLVVASLNVASALRPINPHPFGIFVTRAENNTMRMIYTMSIFIRQLPNETKKAKFEEVIYALSLLRSFNHTYRPNQPFAYKLLEIMMQCFVDRFDFINSDVLDIYNYFKETANHYDVRCLAIFIKCGMELNISNDLGPCVLKSQLDDDPVTKDMLENTIVSEWFGTTATLLTLPRELRDHLLGFLPVTDRLHFSAVSRATNIPYDDKSETRYWGNMVDKHFPNADFTAYKAEQQALTNQAVPTKKLYRAAHEVDFQNVPSRLQRQFRSLFLAIKENDPERVMKLIKDYPDLLKCIYNNHVTDFLLSDIYKTIKKSVSEPSSLLNRIYNEIIKISDDDGYKIYHAILAMQPFASVAPVFAVNHLSYIWPQGYPYCPTVYLAILFDNVDMIRGIIQKFPVDAALFPIYSNNHQVSMIHYAAENGSPAAVNTILAAYPDSVNGTDELGRTPFCTAVMAKKMDVIETLLSTHHADATILSPEQLGYADFVGYALLAMNDIKLAKSLLDFGVKANFSTLLLNPENEDIIIEICKHAVDIAKNRNDLDMAAELRIQFRKMFLPAVRVRAYKFVYYLLAMNLTGWDQLYEEALRVSVEHNSLELTQELLRAAARITKAAIVNIITHNIRCDVNRVGSDNPIESPNLETINLLMKRVTGDEHSVLNLLFEAIHSNNGLDVICAIASNCIGSIIDAMNEQGITLLFSAVRCGRSDVVKFLLDSGANTAITYGNNADTILHCAAFHGQLDILTLLVIRDPSLLHARNQHGMTALEMLEMMENMIKQSTFFKQAPPVNTSDLSPVINYLKELEDRYNPRDRNAKRDKNKNDFGLFGPPDKRRKYEDNPSRPLPSDISPTNEQNPLLYEEVEGTAIADAAQHRFYPGFQYSGAGSSGQSTPSSPVSEQATGASQLTITTPNKPGQPPR